MLRSTIGATIHYILVPTRQITRLGQKRTINPHQDFTLQSFFSGRGFFNSGRHQITFKEIRGKPHLRWTICERCRSEKLQIYQREADWKIRRKPHLRWKICGSCRSEKLRICPGEVDCVLEILHMQFARWWWICRYIYAVIMVDRIMYAKDILQD